MTSTPATIPRWATPRLQLHRRWIICGPDVLDEWGMRIGTAVDADNPRHRKLTFFDSRFTASGLDVFFANGTSAVSVGTLRIEKPEVSSDAA